MGSVMSDYHGEDETKCFTTAPPRREVDLLNTMLVLNGPHFGESQAKAITMLCEGRATEDTIVVIEKMIDETDWENFVQGKNGDEVHTPGHYFAYPMEPIWFIVMMGINDPFVFNALKYLFRYPYKKDAKKDLQKAARYLTMKLKYDHGDQAWHR